MSEEKEETREIKLVEGLESGTYGLGTVHVTVESGKTATVPRNDARILVGGGNFEYTKIEAAPDKSVLMKLLKDELVTQAETEFTKSAGESVDMFDFKSLTKDKLSDYVSTPAMRDTIIAPVGEDGEITTSAGGADVAPAIQFAGSGLTGSTVSSNAVTNSTTSTTSGDFN